MTTDPTPATDRPPLDLDAIRARAARYAEDREVAAAHGLAASLTAVDVEELLAEVTALRAEVASMLRVGQRLTTENQDLRAELDAARAERDELAAELDRVQAGWDAAKSEADAFDELIDRTVADANRALTQRDAARAYVALHLSPECQHTNAHSGCDGTVVCKGRCWCVCHNEEATDG